MVVSTVSVVNNVAYPYQGNRTRVADESGYLAARATRDGSLYAFPWKQGLVFEGRAFHVSVGALSTPIQGGGAGTIIDLEQPEFVLSIPSGTSVMPLRIAVQLKTPLLATDSDVVESLIAVDRTTSDTTGITATAETIFNMKTSNPIASACTAKSAATGDITAPPTLGIELEHRLYTADSQTAVGTTWGDMQYVYEPAASPLIVGPATLFVYWGGTVATSGYAEIEWAEFATSLEIA